MWLFSWYSVCYKLRCVYEHMPRKCFMNVCWFLSINKRLLYYTSSLTTFLSLTGFIICKSINKHPVDSVFLSVDYQFSHCYQRVCYLTHFLGFAVTFKILEKFGFPRFVFISDRIYSFHIRSDRALCLPRCQVYSEGELTTTIEILTDYYLLYLVIPKESHDMASETSDKRSHYFSP